MPYSGADSLKIDCDDCRSYWLRKNTKLIDSINSLNCLNGKPFIDSTNFAKCAEMKFV